MSKIIQAFEKEVNLTEQGLKDLTETKKNLVIDVSTKSGFTLARKERTERNKLVEQVKRVAIDTKASIDGKRKEIVDSINNIYEPIVDLFEAEDLRQKQEKEKLAKIEEDRVNGIKAKIANLRNFSLSLYGKTSDELSEIIEAVDMIDIAENFAEFTQEAMQVKSETLGELNIALSGAIQSEQLATEKEAFEKEKAEFALWKKSQEPVVSVGSKAIDFGGGVKELTSHEQMIKKVLFWAKDYGVVNSELSDLLNILNQYK